MVEMKQQENMETDETQNKTTCDSSNTHEWQRMIQKIIAGIDESIKSKDSDELSLEKSAQTLGYSPFHFSKKFREVSGMAFRDYLRYRRLAFALKEIRDTDRTILDIALEYGFSSHEAFTRAFKEAYCVSPKDYRKNPVPVVLRTMLRPFDCYLLSIGDKIMTDSKTSGTVKTYFVTIPEHKFLHIRNYESIGYFDFWENSQKSLDRTARQSAEFWTALKENWTTKVEQKTTAEADSLWHF